MKNAKPTYQELEDQIAELNKQLESLKSSENPESSSGRIHAVAALEASEEMFRTTLYCIGDGVITTDIQGTVKQMNPVAEKLTGWSENEAKGISIKEVFKIINEVSLKEVINPVYLVLKEGNIVGLANHTLLIAKDGNQLPIADSGAPIRNEKGEIIGVVLVFRDQSKERENQRKINEALFRLKRAELASKSGNWEIHLDTQKVKSSEGAREIYGIKGEEFDYNYIKSIPLPEYRPLLDAAFKRLIEDNNPYDLEFKIMLPNTGEIKDIHSLSYFDKEQRILFGTIQDITQRKQIELALRKSEELHKVFFDANLDMMFVKDDQRRYLIANSSMANFFGKPKEELIGKTDEILADNSRIYPCKSSDLKALESIIPFTVEEQLGDRIFETTKFPLRLNGVTNGIGGIIRDITERKKGEKLIRTLNEAVKHSPVAITIADADGNIEFVNKEYITLTQYTLDDLKGKKPRIFNTGHLPPIEYEAMWKTLQKGHIWKSEYVNRRKDHTPFHVEVTISAIHDSNGSISNYIIVMDDVTDKKTMIDELIVAKDKAEESERLKSAFLANMSHEIRTPMNGIMGFAELLKEPDLTGEEQQSYIAIIEQSGTRMLNIINDIICISKIESGLMKVYLQDSNINDQMEFIYTFFKPEVEGKGMRLLCNKELSSAEAIIHTDREKLFAILTNLVKNAIKYSDEGFIEFGYKRKDKILEFYVKDSGVGIPEGRQKAIFERFIQADITDKTLEGAGLGLSISKAYVEMLGGVMWVESEVGKGSNFYFTLPYQGR